VRSFIIQSKSPSAQLQAVMQSCNMGYFGDIENVLIFRVF
jgi:hypothetical protein